jgi:hypothetical protein
MRKLLWALELGPVTSDRRQYALTAITVITLTTAPLTATTGQTTLRAVCSSAPAPGSTASMVLAMAGASTDAVLMGEDLADEDLADAVLIAAGSEAVPDSAAVPEGSEAIPADSTAVPAGSAAAAASTVEAVAFTGVEVDSTVEVEATAADTGKDLQFLV